mgnify:CR=1 FL=1
MADNKKLVEKRGGCVGIGCQKREVAADKGTKGCMGGGRR